MAERIRLEERSPDLRAKLLEYFTTEAGKPDSRLVAMAREGQISEDDCCQFSREQPHQRRMDRFAKGIEAGEEVTVDSSLVVAAIPADEWPSWLHAVMQPGGRHIGVIVCPDGTYRPSAAETW
jgi:hypothetical protein